MNGFVVEEDLSQGSPSLGIDPPEPSTQRLSLAVDVSGINLEH